MSIWYRTQDWIVGRLPVGMVENNWEGLITLLGIPAGISIVFGGRKPRSISETLPNIVATGWGVAMLVGCSLIVVGLVRRAPSRAIERAGCQLFGAASFSFGTVVFFTSWPYGFLAASTYFGCALACLVQLWLIRKGYRMRREKQEE